MHKKYFIVVIFLSLSIASLCQNNLKEITIPIDKKQLAVLPIEDVQYFPIGGSYFIKGFASLKKKGTGIIIEVALNGNTPVNNMGDVDFFGTVNLLVNKKIVQTKNLVNLGKPQILPNDGTQHIGETQFNLISDNYSSIEIEVKTGYVIQLPSGGGTATPMPNTTDFKVTLHGLMTSPICSNPNFSWVTDNIINNCKFTPPTTNSKDITSIEFGNKFDPKSSDYHCYYVETKICNINDCNQCNIDSIFNLMLNSKKFIAPTDDNGKVTNCSQTLVNIPLTLYNPIMTTVHKTKYSIINYTVLIKRKGILDDTGHTLHPGRVQRTIFKRGDEIYIGTMGDGTGTLGSLNEYFGDVTWKGVDQELINALKCKKALPSLFLFDLSGSMNEQGASGKPKIEEAKLAAKTTLQNISKSATQGVKQEVEIRGFSGGCVTDPTYPITNGFTTDVSIIENAINSIRYPDGGTPLAEAIEASKQKLQQHLNNTGAKQAKLIILSDGQATCTPIRPNGVFATGQVTITLSGNQQNNGTASPIKYYAVGFNIAPGSPAERDLQYLAQISGGKYLNAQNQFELTRAFQKFNRIYIPKPTPALMNLPSTATDIFNKGLVLIENETYPDALERYREFATQNAMDCNGAFNLALMCEANDLYKAAAKYYETYLTLCPNPSDKDEVMRQIENVKKDYETYIQYNRNVIISDMAYLDYHFKKIQNGESVALATEFVGFIKEKWLYYKNLSDILEIDTRPFKSSAQEVFRGFQDCVETIKRNPQAWDRDATPVLSRTYINMERLLQAF